MDRVQYLIERLGRTGTLTNTSAKIIYTLTLHLEYKIDFYFEKAKADFVGKYNAEQDKEEVLLDKIDSTSTRIESIKGTLLEGRELINITDSDIQLYKTVVQRPDFLARERVFIFNTKETRRRFIYYLCLFTSEYLGDTDAKENDTDLDNRVIAAISETEYFSRAAQCLASIKFLKYLKAFNPNAPAENIKPAPEHQVELAPRSEVSIIQKRITPTATKAEPTFEELFRDNIKATKLVELLKADGWLDQNEIWTKKPENIVPVYAAIWENDQDKTKKDIFQKEVRKINITKTLLMKVFCKKFGIPEGEFSVRTGTDFNFKRDLIKDFSVLFSQL